MGKTIAEQFIEEGFEKGLHRGLAEGRTEGRAEGRRLMLHLLQQRFGAIPAASAERVLAADPDTLDGWAGRMFSARSLDELLG